MGLLNRQYLLSHGVNNLFSLSLGVQAEKSNVGAGLTDHKCRLILFCLGVSLSAF